MLAVRSSTVKAARQFVGTHHRHSSVPVGGLFAVAICDGDTVRGVGIASRPVSRNLADGDTVEITRVCTDGVPNGCSMIYGALTRAARALGYTRAVTYCLQSEPGTSLRAAGWEQVAALPARSWATSSDPARGRLNLFGVEESNPQPRIRWEKRLCSKRGY